MNFSSNLKQNASNKHIMKLIRHFIYAAVALAVVFACTKPEGTEGTQDLESAGDLTASVESATPTSVTFSCELKVNPDAGKSFRAGIMYSTSQRFTTTNAKRVVIENPVNGTHTLTIDGLVFSNIYYYSTYVYHHGKYELSDVSSFTTADVEVDSEISDLQHNEVTISGQIHLDENTKGVLGVGVKFSSTPDFSSDVIENTLDVDDEGNFSARITGLEEGTTYYYACYVSQGNRKVPKETKKFTTMDPYSDAFGELDASAATDLSAAGSSNSYIVTGSGLYKFKAVQGNSTEHVGEVATVNVLWESFGTATAPRACELISATWYKDDYAIFNVPADFKEGNALIAAKNSDGEILWSWHIWLLSSQPKEHVYANEAGIMMDRNLGALSMVKGDAKGFGLLYQWGRKDPFLGSSVVECNKAKIAESTITWPDAVQKSETTGTLAYVTANPTTFVGDNAYASDWLYSPVENALWTTSEAAKSVYDPCPAGWRVPDADIWSKAGFTKKDQYKLDSANYGTSYNISSPSTAWYPCAGCRYSSDGRLMNHGTVGCYWSASQDSGWGSEKPVYLCDYPGPPFLTINGRAYANSVRCVKEMSL